MRGIPLQPHKIDQIKKLRLRGFSYNEIVKDTGISKTLVCKYSKGLVLGESAMQILIEKRGHSKVNSQRQWLECKEKSHMDLGGLSAKDKILILSCLYWGEGNKRDLILINSDPNLVRVFLSCLLSIGIKISEIRFSLRLFEDIDEIAAKEFWSLILNITKDDFGKTEIKYGRKTGKLKYGMCRVRVVKNAKYFKLIMSYIERIKEVVTLP